MSILDEAASAYPAGTGIIKPSARPISVRVGDDGEYWLCDADVDGSRDFREQGCVAHSEIQMAEGG